MEDSQVDNKLDKLLTAIENLGTNLRKEIKEQTETLEQKLNSIIDRNNTIEEKQEHLERKIKYLERCIKRKNLVIYNIKETEKSNEELVDTILHLLNTILEIKTEYFEIDFARRLGNKGDKIRPILLGLTTQIKKDTIMKNKTKLRHYKEDIIYIKEDYIKEDFNTTVQENKPFSKHQNNQKMTSGNDIEKKQQRMPKRNRQYDNDPNANENEPTCSTKLKRPKTNEKVQNDKHNKIRNNSIHRFLQSNQKEINNINSNQHSN